MGGRVLLTRGRVLKKERNPCACLASSITSQINTSKQIESLHILGTKTQIKSGTRNVPSLSSGSLLRSGKFSSISFLFCCSKCVEDGGGLGFMGRLGALFCVLVDNCIYSSDDRLGIWFW